jgi:hypothetical protein
MIVLPASGPPRLVREQPFAKASGGEQRQPEVALDAVLLRGVLAALEEAPDSTRRIA